MLKYLYCMKFIPILPIWLWKFILYQLQELHVLVTVLLFFNDKMFAVASRLQKYKKKKKGTEKDDD